MQIPKYIIKIVLDINESQENISIKRLARKIEREFYMFSDYLPTKKDGFLTIGNHNYNTDKILYYDKYDNVEEIVEFYYKRSHPIGTRFNIDDYKIYADSIRLMVEIYEEEVNNKR